MPEPAAAPPRDRKSRDRALILPLIGLMLLLPPGAGIFRLGGTVLGLPATLVYVFAVWGLLIAATARLSRRLRDELDASEPPDGREGP